MDTITSIFLNLEKVSENRVETFFWTFLKYDFALSMSWHGRNLWFWLPLFKLYPPHFHGRGLSLSPNCRCLCYVASLNNNTRGTVILAIGDGAMLHFGLESESNIIAVISCLESERTLLEFIISSSSPHLSWWHIACCND